jgi:hypothetical protein
MLEYRLWCLSYVLKIGFVHRAVLGSLFETWNVLDRLKGMTF